LPAGSDFIQRVGFGQDIIPVRRLCANKNNMPTTQLNIRPATASDRPQWDPLWQGYLAFYESSLEDEVTDLLWQRIMDPAHEILVC
jgi:hypothetical protein